MSCLSWKEAKVQLILYRLVRAGGCVVVDWALAAQARSPALNQATVAIFLPLVYLISLVTLNVSLHTLLTILIDIG